MDKRDQIAAVADVLREHESFEELVAGTHEFIATCVTCGSIPNSPRVRFTHPAEMALMKMGILTPEYRRGA